MAKFSGFIGYALTVDQGNGVFVDEIVEKEYTGDILRDSRAWTSQQNQVNDNLVINNRLSIIADEFAYTNHGSVKYVKIGEVLWKITNIEILRPRLILSLGGVYNA